MEWEATDSLDVLNVATPLPSNLAAPSVIVPSLKVTIPVGVALDEVTIAVKVTDWPKVDGLIDDVNVVLELALLTT